MIGLFTNWSFLHDSLLAVWSSPVGGLLAVCATGPSTSIEEPMTLKFDDHTVAGLLPVPSNNVKATVDPRSLPQSVKTLTRASCEFLLYGRKGSMSDEIRFLKQLIMGDSKIIVKLIFCPDSLFLLEDILTITKVISNSSSCYCLVTTMCF